MTTLVTDRNYGIMASTAVKPPVQAVAIANVNIQTGGVGPIITLGGTYTPNPGDSSNPADRILLSAQTNPVENGIYNANVGAWIRTGDFDGNRDAVQGTLVTCLQGGIAFYQLVTPNPIIIGTTALSFTQIGAVGNKAAIVGLLGADPIFDPTIAELAAVEAGYVPPVNLQYRPGEVDRYFTNINVGDVAHMVDSTPAWNAAIAQCRILMGSEVSAGATGLYLTLSPIDATFTGSDDQMGVKINWRAGPSYDAGHGILAKHNGVAVINCTGCDGFAAYDLPIGTDANIFPQTGVCWARNAAAGSQNNILVNCHIAGKFSGANFYNYASENSKLFGCYFANYCMAAGTCTRIYTANNVLGLASPLTQAPMSAGTHSTTVHTAVGCDDLNVAGTSTSDCVLLDETDGLHNFGGWAHSAGGVEFSGTASSVGATMTVTVINPGSPPLAVGMTLFGAVPGGTTITAFGTGTGGAGTYTLSDATGFLATAIVAGYPGRSVFFFNQASAPSNNLQIWGLKTESGGVVANFGILWDFAVASPVGVSIRSCHLNSSTFALYAPAGTTLVNMDLAHITEIHSHGAYFVGTVKTSSFDTQSMLLAGFTSQNNSLKGYAEGWTGITRVNDSWEDTGTALKIWTPAAGTIGAAFTVDDNCSLLTASVCEVDAALVSSGGGAATAGETILGLPFPATHYSADVSFVDTTAGASLGNGYIVAGQSVIHCPAFTWTAGHVIAVSARYKVA